MGTKAAIEVRNISFKIDDFYIFRDFSTTIISGEKTCLNGANGSGKSTLLKLIAGIIKPNNGEIIYPNKMTNISYLFQNSDDGFIAPTVIDDLCFSLLNSGVSREFALLEANRMLEFFGIPKLKDRYIHTLSGGQKRLVAIISTLMSKSDFYLLDEPLNELDAQKVKLFLDYIDSSDGTFIISSHSPLLQNLCDNQISLN